jgi:hypothetical protein
LTVKHKDVKKGKERHQDWYEPSIYTSMYQFVRVSVVPSDSDSSTLFVILSNPAKEEYIIKNQTDIDFYVCKWHSDTKKPSKHIMAKVEARSEAAIVWDTPEISYKFIHLACTNKGNHVSLDKVSAMTKKKERQRHHLFKLNQLEYFTNLVLTPESGTKILKIKCRAFNEKEEEKE